MTDLSQPAQIGLNSATPEPPEDGPPIIRNARQCELCGAPADRHHYGFQCTRHPGHQADLTTGIFDDLSFQKTRSR